MIPNHKQFIEAIREKKKVSLRFYSKADSAVIDLVCAPLDYGRTGAVQDGVNRYQLWDYSRNNGSYMLFLLPEQILSLSVLGAVFDPAEFGAPPPTWSIPQDWRAPSGAGPEVPSAGLAQAQKHLTSLPNNDKPLQQIH
jgi:hypothetical protein